MVSSGWWTVVSRPNSPDDTIYIDAGREGLNQDKEELSSSRPQQASLNHGLPQKLPPNVPVPSLRIPTVPLINI